jgi:hypothetical protein
MQFHYVVGFDSEKKRWWVEADAEAYFPDGNVWDDDAATQTGYGWCIPEENSIEEALDLELWRTLSHLVDIIPVPQEA